MWTALLLLFLVSFDIGAAGRPWQAESSDARPDSSDPNLQNAGNAAARLPRKFRGNSRTRRVHIENQTGFDGKVEKIHINSDEDLPGVRAYGTAKKNLENNGHIQEIVEKNVEGVIEYRPRIVRSIEAYGKSKEHLTTNGEIEIVQKPVVVVRQQTRRGAAPRSARSIGATAKPEAADGRRKDSEDLEAQDAKVFRPLFVYRQQQAKRQHRVNNYAYGYQPYRPYYYRLPAY
nr:uncharacterized protein LOC117228613 [Megalopta genalis]